MDELAPTLHRDDKGLCLVQGRTVVRGDFERMLPRLRAGNLQRELLVRAARIKGIEHPSALDATAGLGEDSLLLAAAGFTVRLFERNPTIAALLEDAIERAANVPELAEAVARMSVESADSVAAMRSLGEGAGAQAPDVILLDPMFPGRKKNAQVKKKLQLLQHLEQPCEDEEALLAAALAARPRKIVIKRPAKGPYLAGRKPDYSIAGKAVRYDCISLPR